LRKQNNHLRLREKEKGKGKKQNNQMKLLIFRRFKKKTDYLTQE